MQIKYEDLAIQPRRELSKIYNFVGIRSENHIEQNGLTHNIGGNVIRFTPLKEIGKGNSWDKALALKERLELILNGGPLIYFLDRLFRFKYCEFKNNEHTYDNNL